MPSDGIWFYKQTFPLDGGVFHGDVDGYSVLNEYAFPGGTFADQKYPLLHIMWQNLQIQQRLLRAELAAVDTQAPDSVSGSGEYYSSPDEMIVWYDLILTPNHPATYGSAGHLNYGLGKTGFLYNPKEEPLPKIGQVNHIQALNQRFMVDAVFPSGIWWDLMPNLYGVLNVFVVNLTTEYQPQWSYNDSSWINYGG